MVFLIKLLSFVDSILFMYMIVVIASAVITWVNPDPRNPIVRFLYGVTEPVLYRIRRFIPTNFGGVDVAPVILILLIMLIRTVVISSIIQSLAQVAS